MRLGTGTEKSEQISAGLRAVDFALVSAIERNPARRGRKSKGQSQISAGLRAVDFALVSAIERKPDSATKWKLEI